MYNRVSLYYSGPLFSYVILLFKYYLRIFLVEISLKETTDMLFHQRLFRVSSYLLSPFKRFCIPLLHFRKVKSWEKNKVQFLCIKMCETILKEKILKIVKL